MRLAFWVLPTLVLGCSQDPPSLQASAQPTTFPQGSSTTLTITTTDFELISPTDMHAHLTQALTVAHEAEETGGSEFTNSGHYHVYLDSYEIDPILQGYQASQAVTVHGKAGPHKLIVQLQGEDHKILQPPVRVEIPITLTSTAG